MTNRKQKGVRGQKGVALIMALVILFLLSALAASLIFVTQSEMWASANYRLLTQSRYASEAGAQAAVNWFKNTYTPPTATTYFDMTQSPVQCKSSGGGCPTVGSAIVLGPTSNYPDTTSATQNSFNTAFNGVTVPGLANATYTVTAKLLQMQSAQTQTWQITSVGTIAGARGATTQVVENLQLSSTTGPFIYGLFATGNTCTTGGVAGGVTMTGGSTEDAYTTAGGGTYATTESETGGNVGSNITVNAGGGTIGGSVYVPNTTVGSCPAGLSGGSATPEVSGQTPANTVNTVSYVAPIPNIPAPGATNYTLNSSTALGPGNYGNIVVQGGTLTFSQGTYNVNCLWVESGHTLAISSGPVIINVTGNGCGTAPGGGPGVAAGVGTAISISGGGFANATGIASNLQIYYAGSLNVALSGGSGSYFALDAPNAYVSLSGGGNVYGAIIGLTVNDSGGQHFHYDKNLANLGGSGAAPAYVTSFTWSKN